MRDKLVTLEQAANLVRTGDKVIMMGGLDYTPMALLREIVRGGTTDLNTLGVVGASLNLDFLVGAGRTATVETCDFNFQPFARVAPNYLRLQKQGRIKMKDNT